MNKLLTKRLLEAVGLPTPSYIHLHYRSSMEQQVREVVAELGLPVVTKPVSEGSSLGVSISRDEPTLRGAVADLLNRHGEGLAEAFIDGTEITVGILGTGEGRRALPVLELVSHAEFYSYEAKYTKGMTDLIAPARIPTEAAQAAQETALRAHEELGCRGISRVDMHLDSQQQVWVHELNSVPGLTDVSDVPAAAAAAGMSYDEVILEILASATTRM
jgi:D-alanine-D-alanine ligase